MNEVRGFHWLGNAAQGLTKFCMKRESTPTNDVNFLILPLRTISGNVFGGWAVARQFAEAVQLGGLKPAGVQPEWDAMVIQSSPATRSWNELHRPANRRSNTYIAEAAENHVITTNKDPLPAL
jgi:hypothetical protein